MAYRVHNVVIPKADRVKADLILEKHWMKGDIDAITCDSVPRSNGETTIAYWIAPYLCEDLQIIVDEFKQEGIRVM
jgi:hypothetical protein